tara:strand:- start:17465 stop:17617 length:153 start_codon:yes stop_codon:yes gene_type:complete
MGVIRICKECGNEYYFTGGVNFCKPVCKGIWNKVRDIETKKRRKERNKTY